MKIRASLLVAGALVLSSAAQAKPPGDVCQSDGPVTVCSSYGMGDSYHVYYGGYLIDPGASVYLDGAINGEALGKTRMHQGLPNYRALNAGIKGEGQRVTDIELYFFDDRSQYDSIYGRNYHFQFRY